MTYLYMTNIYLDLKVRDMMYIYLVVLLEEVGDCGGCEGVAHALVQ